MLLTLGHMDLSITLTQSPPILACTPYQMLYQLVNTIPNKWKHHAPRHYAAVKRAPKASEQTKTRTDDHGERNVE
jgi:hypothetical protein